MGNGELTEGRPEHSRKDQLRFTEGQTRKGEHGGQNGTSVSSFVQDDDKLYLPRSPSCSKNQMRLCMYSIKGIIIYH